MGQFLCPTTEDGYTTLGLWFPGSSNNLLLTLDGTTAIGAMRLTGFPVTTGSTTFGTATDTTNSNTTTLYQTFTFGFTALIGGTGQFTVSIINNGQPNAFSNSNLPAMGTTVAQSPTGFVFGTLTQQFFTATPAGVAAINAVYRGRNWSGSLAFAFNWVGSGNIYLLPSAFSPGNAQTVPQLDTTGDYSIDTGRDGDYMGMGRVDRCPRCGTRSNREQWVMDGFYKRLVCTKHDCFDPEDEAKRPIRVPYERPPVNNQG